MANTRDYVLIISKSQNGDRVTVTPFPNNVIQNSDGRNVAPKGGTIAFISMGGTTKLSFSKGEKTKEDIRVHPFDSRDDIVVRDLSEASKIGVTIHEYTSDPGGVTLPLEDENTDIPYSMIIDVE